MKDSNISDCSDSDTRSQHILIENEDVDDLVNMEGDAEPAQERTIEEKE